ncbi:MAG TPA: LysR substrate-binding domain-containing protein [Candidatus Binataceae bacterium]|nr:LysR substrate-binding domain-containing protein [Candidatus Binataceae bacterium]
MHIETLKVFCDIIESGSFSYAASQNFVTQSAVSQQVRSLEEKYDCRLIERGRAGVKPTPAGQLLYTASKEIVRRFLELENRLREIGSVIAGSIRIGTVYSVGLHELPPYLTEFLRNFPAVNVHLEYLRSNKIYEDLLEGKIDLGVVAYPSKRSQVVSVPFRHDELVLIVPADSPLAKQTKVNVGQLQGQKFVGFERDIPTRKASDRILRDHGVKPNYMLEFDNIETIKRAVEIGLGCAIVPRMTVEHEVARGSLKMLEFQEGTFLRPLAIIYKRGRELSPAVRKFIDTLTQSGVLPKMGSGKAARGDRAERSASGDGAGSAAAERAEKAEKSA